MDRPAARSWPKYAAVAAVILVAAIGVAIGIALSYSDDGAEDDPDLVEVAQATLTARATTQASLATSPPPAVPSPTATVVETSSVCAADRFAVDLPTGRPRFDLEHADWYGNPEAGLWASPADFGVFMPEGFAEAPSLWFAGQPTSVMWFGTSLPVTMTGEQLDGDATLGPVEPHDLTNNIQWTDVLIPEPGCWELNGTTGDIALTITVEVVPIEFRPDFQILMKLEEARPYEPPATCPVSPLTSPAVRAQGIGAHFWFEGEDDIIADSAGWFVAGEQQSIGVYGGDVDSGLTVTVRSLDAGNGGDFEATVVTLGSTGRVARFIFPAPGCWELEMETPSTTTTFTVYVYPEECLPVLDAGLFLVSCEAPQS